jgi:hypothetical protein
MRPYMPHRMLPLPGGRAIAYGKVVVPDGPKSRVGTRSTLCESVPRGEANGPRLFGRGDAERRQPPVNHLRSPCQGGEGWGEGVRPIDRALPSPEGERLSPAVKAHDGRGLSCAVDHFLEHSE